MASEWNEVALEDVADEITVGYVGPMASEYVDDGIPFLRSQNVEPLRVNDGDLKFITPEFHQKICKSRLTPGNVVIVRTGKPGACSVIPNWLSDANCSDLVIVRCGPRINNRFLAYYVNTVAIHHVSAHLVGAVQQHFNVGSARKIRISLPPIDEQRQIVHVLGTFDDKIELNRRMNETLEAMARALFKSWFVDFDPVRAKATGRKPPGLDAETAALFPASFQDSPLGKIPKGWEVVEIASLCRINAWTLGKDDPLDPIEYVEISEVVRGDINAIQVFRRGEEPSRARRRLRHGDTVLSTVRPDRRSYFLCLNPSPHFVASTGFAVLSPDSAPWSFVHVAITQPEVFDHLGHQADGGAYPAVRPDIIAKWQVAWPSVPQIAKSFHILCAPLYERMERNRCESRTIANIRDTLLPRLLSGEIRAKDAEQEVEARL